MMENALYNSAEEYNKNIYSHSFIFDEGHWILEGIYKDEHENECKMQSDIIVEHNKNNWLVDTILSINIERELKFNIKQSIQPWHIASKSTRWTSQHPTLGQTYGKLSVLGDTILSQFETADKIYKGAEFTVQYRTDMYKISGILAEQMKIVGSWNAILTKQI